MFAIIRRKRCIRRTHVVYVLTRKKTELENRALFNRYHTISDFDEYNRYEAFSYNCTRMTAMAYNIERPTSCGLRFSDVWHSGHESVACKTNRRSHRQDWWFDNYSKLTTRRVCVGHVRLLNYNRTEWPPMGRVTSLCLRKTFECRDVVKSSDV